MSSFIIRRAEQADAAGIADCFNGLDYEDLGEEAACPYTPEIVRRDMIGDGALLQTEVAMADGRVIGAAAHNLGYHAETARHARWLEMLFVQADWRSQGVGEALMREVARQALLAGCDCVAWGVRRHNLRGIAFYDRIGAGSEATDIRTLMGDALQSLGRR